MDYFIRARKLGFTIPNLSSSLLKSETAGGASTSFHADIMNGRILRDHLLQECKLLSSGRVIPKLAVIYVGRNPASHIYVKNKITTFQNLGFSAELFRFEDDSESSNEKILQLINSLNSDPHTHGILLQMPLPQHLDPTLLLQAISPQKDVDGLTAQNIGLVTMGEFEKAFIPCTPFGIRVLLESYDVALQGKRAIVIGRSQLVGKPMAQLLLHAHCTVIMAHSFTPDLKEETLRADVVIVAAGAKGLIRKEHVMPGACVVDVGINHTEKGLCGDCDLSVTEKAKLVTPVPGGVGPITISMLVLNTAIAAWDIG